jgi:hypothetical protein
VRAFRFLPNFEISSEEISKKQKNFEMEKTEKFRNGKRRKFRYFIFFFGLHRGLTIELAFVVLCPYHSASSAAAHCYATLCLFLVSCLFSLEKIVCYLLPSTNPFL